MRTNRYPLPPRRPRPGTSRTQGHTAALAPLASLSAEGPTRHFGDLSDECPVGEIIFVIFFEPHSIMNPTTETHTIRLHRVLRAKPERVYRAFLDADAKAKWMPPHGFTGKVHQLDARVGGTYRMSFTNFTTGSCHTFGGTYTELVPNERICCTDKFEEPDLPGEMEVTVELKDVPCGTDLKITQAGVPAMIPEAGCYQSWQESFVLLAHLVEPEIPDEV